MWDAGRRLFAGRFEREPGFDVFVVVVWTVVVTLAGGEVGVDGLLLAGTLVCVVGVVVWVAGVVCVVDVVVCVAGVVVCEL